MFALKTNPCRATAIAGAVALIAAGIVGVTGSAAQAAALTYTAAPASGGFNAAQTVALTGKNFRTAGGTALVGTTANTNVKLATSCGTSASTAVGAVATGIVTSSVNIASATRLVLQVNPGGATTDAKTAYKVCVYNVAGTTLAGSATWTAYPTATITHVNGIDTVAGAGATDAQVPAYGGTTVALDGTNFTAKSAVKVDNVAATNVKFIDATSITFTLPPTATGIAAANADIVVTTEAGAGTGGTDVMDYLWAIDVSPKVITTGTILSVKGSNFLALAAQTNGFAATADGKNAAIVFSSIPYAGTAGATSDAGELAGGETVCANVTVVSDTELVCTVPAIEAAAGVVTRTVTLTSDDTEVVAAGETTTVTSGATVTYADF